MTAAPVTPVAAAAADAIAGREAAGAATPRTGVSFAHMLKDGLADVDRKVAEADAKVAAFAVDDTIPPHQVIYAIEQARHSLELMLQIRTHVTEGFQELMRMQL